MKTTDPEWQLEGSKLKLECIKVVADARARTGTYAHSTVIDEAKAIYQWLKPTIPKEKATGTVKAKKRQSG